MSHDEIDNILSREEEILPSSGFAASVMDAVRREAAAPAPIPFPWKRALPVFILAGFVLVLVAGSFVLWAARLGSAVATSGLSADSISSALPTAKSGPASSAQWIVAALALSLVSVMLSRRLAGSRS